MSKADGSQVHDLQRDALVAAGVDPEHIDEDAASGRLDKRPGLDGRLKVLRRDDTLVTWKLDRLGRDLRRLVNTVGDLTKRGIGLKVLAGEGTSIDTIPTTANGRLIFAIFAGLASARARGMKADPLRRHLPSCGSPRPRWASPRQKEVRCAPHAASPTRHSPQAKALIECSLDVAEKSLRQGYRMFEATIVPALASLSELRPAKTQLGPENIAHILASAVRGFKQTATTQAELRLLIKELLALSLGT